MIKTGCYRHYKDNYYIVTGQGIHTETSEDMVSYFDITDQSKVYFRPLSMFEEYVEVDVNVEPLLIPHRGLTEKRRTPRFKFVVGIEFSHRDNWLETVYNEVKMNNLVKPQEKIEVNKSEPKNDKKKWWKHE